MHKNSESNRVVVENGVKASSQTESNQKVDSNLENQKLIDAFEAGRTSTDQVRSTAFSIFAEPNQS